MFGDTILDAIARVLFALGTLISATAAAWAAIKAQQAHTAVVEVKADVHKIEVATNSMKDALVQATGDAKLLEGVAKGRADQKAETKREREY